MSGNEIKDNNNFEFIREQVIEKKRKKLRKLLMPLFMTIFLAVLFGVIAAVTFVVAEPKLYKLLNREEETKEPVLFPTLTPMAEDVDENNSVVPAEEGEDNTATDSENSEDPGTVEIVEPTPTPVIVEQSIEATLEDLTSIYDDIRLLSYETNKSLVEVSSTFTVTDWLFGTSSEKTVNTTGLIIASDDTKFMILVSLDRVKDANNIRIKFSDTTYTDAVLMDHETEVNVALLSVLKADISKSYLSGMRVADIGESNTIPIGSPVVAIGNPNGYIDSLEIGIVTSKGSYANITDNRIELFNTDIDFNKNSDGIIINLKGRVVGWITRTLSDEDNEGLSSVIGISKLLPTIYQMTYQQPRIYFGIISEDITSDVKQELNLTSGIFVSEVQADSPAFEAGLKNGDIILSINEQSILSTNNFYNTIAANKAGDTITVKVLRTVGSSPKEIDLTVVLTEKAQ